MTPVDFLNLNPTMMTRKRTTAEVTTAINSWSPTAGLNFQKLEHDFTGNGDERIMNTTLPEFKIAGSILRPKSSAGINSMEVSVNGIATLNGLIPFNPPIFCIGGGVRGTTINLDGPIKT